MKKLKTRSAAALILGSAMAVSLAGCAGNQTSAPSEASPTTSAPETTTAAPETTAAQSGIYTPGTYEGSAKGFGGQVTVSITVDTDAITDRKSVV